MSQRNVMSKAFARGVMAATRKRQVGGINCPYDDYERARLWHLGYQSVIHNK
jgi:hypothetical protein